jgi:hypothetical protein
MFFLSQQKIIILLQHLGTSLATVLLTNALNLWKKSTYSGFLGSIFSELSLFNDFDGFQDTSNI